MMKRFPINNYSECTNGSTAHSAQLFCYRELEKTRLGLSNSRNYRGNIKLNLVSSHCLSDITLEESTKVPACNIAHADLDKVEHRFLLCGRVDGGIGIHSVDRFAEISNEKERKFALVAGISKRKGHKESVRAVQWYPADTGIFTSSCCEKLKIWDTNRLKAVETMYVAGYIQHHHMSPSATNHSLVSVATDSGNIVLCDLRTGSSIHRLQGHIDGVKYVQWSPRHQYHLASAGLDKTIRMWDIRSSRGCILMMNGHSKLSDRTFKVSDPKSLPMAHRRSVSTILFSTDGLWLVSRGIDCKLSLWNTNTGKDMHSPYFHNKTHNTSSVHMTVSDQLHEDTVFVPTAKDIRVYGMLSGKLINTLKGHISDTSGCIYNELTMDLYSWGNDPTLLIWTPKMLLSRGEDEDSSLGCRTRKSMWTDDWSSDEG